MNNDYVLYALGCGRSWFLVGTSAAFAWVTLSTALLVNSKELCSHPLLCLSLSNSFGIQHSSERCAACYELSRGSFTCHQA